MCVRSGVSEVECKSGISACVCVRSLVPPCVGGGGGEGLSAHTCTPMKSPVGRAGQLKRGVLRLLDPPWECGEGKCVCDKSWKYG